MKLLALRVRPTLGTIFLRCAGSDQCGHAEQLPCRAGLSASSSPGNECLASRFLDPREAADTNVWKTAEPAAHLAKGPWWEVFQDAELNRLETLATASNQELAAAAARFEEARTSVTVARSGLFPTLAFDPSYARHRTSDDEPPGGHATNPSATFNTFTLPFTRDGSWIFGAGCAASRIRTRQAGGERRRS